MQVTSQASRLELAPERFISWGLSAWGDEEAILARDGLSGLPVAWQLVPKVPASAWQRFRALAPQLARPLHPGIACVLDCGREERSTWVAEEWVPGTWSLAEWAATDPLSAARLRELLIHCASALGALHAAGVVHGALSPWTLRVAGAAGRVNHPWIIASGRWLLGDSRARDRRGRFEAPEIAAGSEPTFRSDVYGLGQSLLALAGAGIAESQDGAPESQPALAPLVALLAAMVAPDPEARPAHGTEVARLARELPAIARGRGSISQSHAAREPATFVGRAREYALAAEILARAARGETHALEVRGASGSGKSAFLRAVAAAAEERGFEVLALDLRAGTTPDPERALTQSLARALGFAPPVERAADRHPEQRAARLALVLGRALVRTGRPCLTIFDPIDGSAAEILPFLRQLIRALGPRPFLACLGRTEPAHLPASEVIELAPLDVRAVEQLLTPWTVDRADALALAPELRARTGGWPLALRLAIAEEAAGMPGSTPSSALVPAAIARLGPEAREYAELVALWDGPLPAGISAQLWPASTKAEGVPDWLIGRNAAGLVFLASEAGREALLKALPPLRRSTLHARLLAALGVASIDEQLYSEVFATHAIGAGEAGRGARSALAAARADRTAGRTRPALAHYRQALIAGEADPAAIELFQAAFEAAELAIATGEWLEAGAALAVCERAQAWASIAEPRRFEALLARAVVFRERRLLEEARAACTAARELVLRSEDVPPAAEARIDLEAAAIDFTAGEGAEGERKLARALPQLTAGGREDLLPVALNRLATLRSLAGEPKEALRLALAAARRARPLGAAEVRIRSLVNGAFFAFQLDRRRQAFRLLDRAQALLAQTPHAGLRVSALVHRAELLALERRFSEAEAALLEARQVRLETGGRSRLAAILITLGNLRGRSGRLRAAAAAYDEAIALAEELGTPEIHSARGNLGALLVRMGEEREGERLVRLGLADTRPDRRALGLLNLAALCRRTGRVTEATAALDDALAALAGRNPVGERRARVERARLRLAARDPEGALTELAALGAPDPGDPAGAAEEHWTAALARTATGRDAHHAWVRALASAETAGDPTLHAEIVLAALEWAGTGPEELAARPDAIAGWLSALAHAARATDAPPIAHAVRTLALAARSPVPSAFSTRGLAARLAAVAAEPGHEDSFAARLERELAPLGARAGAVIVALELEPGRELEAATGASGPRALPIRPYRTALRAFDRELFRAALARTGGQVPAAARLLRLPESTFRYRAGKAGVLRPRTTEPKPDS